MYSYEGGGENLSSKSLGIVREPILKLGFSIASWRFLEEFLHHFGQVPLSFIPYHTVHTIFLLIFLCQFHQLALEPDSEFGEDH